MLNFYRVIKTGTLIATLASIAWLSASSFANEPTKKDTESEQTFRELQPAHPKLFSELTEAEKARFTKYELEKLKENEEEMKSLEQPEK